MAALRLGTPFGVAHREYKLVDVRCRGRPEPVLCIASKKRGQAMDTHRWPGAVPQEPVTGRAARPHDAVAAHICSLKRRLPARTRWANSCSTLSLRAGARHTFSPWFRGSTFWTSWSRYGASAPQPIFSETDATSRTCVTALEYDGSFALWAVDRQRSLVLDPVSIRQP